ncbi:hypothetical protein F4806DRAFT_403789 [Annulohypoxylon nitens]|nr:hypothetical protein F4806DRAFT_403789 [Annulohypoxylon nitens]
MSSLMTRSGRLYSSVKSKEQHFIKRILLPSQDQRGPCGRPWCAFAKMDQAIIECDIPSIEFDILDVDTIDPILPNWIPLGSGSTADVIRYTTGDGTIDIVPSGSVVALKKFRHHHGSVPGPGTTEADTYETYIAISREIRTFRKHHIYGHPNIAQLLFITWQQDNPFPLLAIELGDHGSLEYFLQEAHLGPTPLQKRHLTLDLVLGLSAVHRAGLIHGDLKPENVLVMAHNDPKRQFVAKLIDFGGTSSDRAVHFTPLWSAPEVMNKDHDIVWVKADVYSLGLIIASLWARPDTPLTSMSNSCILSWIAPSGAPDDLLNCIYFGAKSSLDFCIELLITAVKRNVDLGGFDTSELFDILASMLHPHFWQRPDTRTTDTKRLVQLFVSFGEMLGRDIRQEDDFTELRSTQQSTTKRDDLLTTRALLVHVELLRDSIYRKIAILTKKTNGRSVGGTKKEDLNNAGHDVEPPSHSQFMENLWDLTQRVFVIHDLGAHDSSNLVHTTRLLAEETRLMATMFHYEPFLTDPRMVSISMEVSAVCGYKNAMHLVALMDTGTVPRAYILLYLSLLALSGSAPALQRLHTDWPSHFKIIQEITQTKRLDYEAMKYYDQMFHLRLFEAYREAPSVIEGGITLQRALEIGSITEIEDILNGKIISPDLDEILPGLLHELSCLIDTEAAPLAEVAFERGADLTNMRPCKTPILGCDPLEEVIVPSSWLYSPLSSAIINGKEVLAMTLFWLHAKAKIPIPDFETVIFLSFRYLQHELCKALIRLVRRTHSRSGCCDKTRPCEVIEVLLDGLFVITTSRIGLSDYERRAMHGRNFAHNYEKCLQILLQEGADPTKGIDGNCPLSDMLRLDDSVGLNLFIQHSLKNIPESVVFDRIQMLATKCRVGNVQCMLSPLYVCFVHDSFQCLKLLLQAFPRLYSELPEEHLRKMMLQYACRCSNISRETICVFLDSPIDGTTSTGDFYFTLLCEALLNCNIRVANLIASRCSDDLNELVSRNGSMFIYLIRHWAPERNIKLIDSFRWLKEHNGIPSYVDRGSMICEYMFLRPRPTIRSDQIKDAGLLDFLLDDDIYGKDIDKPSKSGFTLIQASALHGHIEAVKVLLSRGADVNVRCPVDGIGGMSAVDWAHYCFLQHCPNNIEAEGSLAIQQWKKDTYSIMVLLRKHADDGPATIPILRVESFAALVREKIFFRELFELKDRSNHCLLSSIWAKRLRLTTKHILRQQPSREVPKTTHLIDLIEHISGDDFIETEGKLYPGWELPVELMDSVSVIAKSFQATVIPILFALYALERDEHEIHDVALCVRNMWRLPPNWILFRISGIMRVDYFIIDSGNHWRVVHKKPALYRGGDDEISVSDPKGKGKGVAIDHRSSMHTYIDLIICPHTAQSTVDSKIGMSCCRVEIEGDSGLIHERYDDTLTDLAFDHLGEIVRATIESDKVEIFEALIDLVGHVKLRDAEGLTPLQRAVVNNQCDMARVLVDRARQLGKLWKNDPLLLQASIMNRNSAMIDMLVEAGADPNGHAPDEIPPLHFCLSQHDEPEIVRTLIRKGADILMHTQKGTPLETARYHERRRSLEVLKKALKDTNVGNLHGNISPQRPVQTSEPLTTQESPELSMLVASEGNASGSRKRSASDPTDYLTRQLPLKLNQVNRSRLERSYSKQLSRYVERLLARRSIKFASFCEIERSSHTVIHTG